MSLPATLTLLVVSVLLPTLVLSTDPAIVDLEHHVCESETCMARCPKQQGITSFNLLKYAGLWYELARTPNKNEEGTTCNTDIYSLKPDEYVTSTYSMTSLKLPGGDRLSLLTIGRIPDLDRPGYFTAYLENGAYVGDATITHIDYDNYIIYYFCLAPPDAASTEDTLPMASVFGRRTELSEEMWAEVREKIKEIGVDPANLEMTDHSNC